MIIPKSLPRNVLSYYEIYESYCRFCKIVDVTPLAFEDWMTKREGPKAKDKAVEFIETVEN